MGRTWEVPGEADQGHYHLPVKVALHSLSLYGSYLWCILSLYTRICGCFTPQQKALIINKSEKQTS